MDTRRGTLWSLQVPELDFLAINSQDHPRLVCEPLRSRWHDQEYQHYGCVLDARIFVRGDWRENIFALVRCMG